MVQIMFYDALTTIAILLRFVIDSLMQQGWEIKTGITRSQVKLSIGDWEKVGHGSSSESEGNE